MCERQGGAATAVAARTCDCFPVLVVRSHFCPFLLPHDSRLPPPLPTLPLLHCSHTHVKHTRLAPPASISFCPLLYHRWSCDCYWLLHSPACQSIVWGARKSRHSQKTANIPLIRCELSDHLHPHLWFTSIAGHRAVLKSVAHLVSCSLPSHPFSSFNLIVQLFVAPLTETYAIGGKE